jgi:hypothetical protein
MSPVLLRGFDYGSEPPTYKQNVIKNYNFDFIGPMLTPSTLQQSGVVLNNTVCCVQ